MSGDEERGELVAVLSHLDVCISCFKPKASEADWEKYDDGEGEHLCWEDGSMMCAPEQGTTREGMYAELILSSSWLASRLKQARADGWEDGYSQRHQDDVHP